MEETWKLLMEAGMPDGAVRPLAAGHLREDLVRRAVQGLAARAEPPEARRVEPLLAWLSAWRHHWPRRFSRTLDGAGERLLARLAAAPIDANRYLKLRRIAVENLSRLL